MMTKLLMPEALVYIIEQVTALFETSLVDFQNCKTETFIIYAICYVLVLIIRTGKKLSLW